MTIVNTISWGNGFNRWDFDEFEGDGNGFKLGGGSDDLIVFASHNVTNCISFNNAAKGFTDNSQTGDFTINRNTAWNNAAVGFQFQTSTSTITDNIAAMNQYTTTTSSQVSLSSIQTASGNSWQDGTTWSNSSFLSVDTSLVTGARQSDGTIAASDFLLPVSGEDIGATTDWS